MNKTLVPGGGTLESTELFAFSFRVVASMNVLWSEVIFVYCLQLIPSCFSTKYLGKMVYFMGFFLCI